MKLNINGTMVTITVHGNSRKETEENTKAFINDLSSVYYESARYNDEFLGCPYSASDRRHKADILFNALDEKGYYKDL